MTSSSCCLMVGILLAYGSRCLAAPINSVFGCFAENLERYSETHESDEIWVGRGYPRELTEQRFDDLERYNLALSAHPWGHLENRATGVRRCHPHRTRFHRWDR